MVKILVVDDEKDIVEILSHSLRRRGYEVETAITGEEGIKKAENKKFDVALLDINLPGMDGIQVLEQIKKIDPEIEVIMVTGFGSIESAIDTLKKGAYDYIQKPVNSDKIAVSVEKALEKRHLTETVALYEISKAIFSTIEMDDLLKTIVDLAIKVLRADDASIMLFDENERLYIAISYGLTEQIQKETRLALGDRIAGWVAKNRQPIILINGLVNDDRFKDIRGREDIKSSMIVPLIKNDKVLGILSVNRLKITENFSNIDLYKSSIFASLVSLALDNANLYKDLKKTQHELIQSNKELEETEKETLSVLCDLKDTHAKLKTNQHQLWQSSKLAALGRLVSDMAHEVNNPLMVVSGRAQLCLMEDIQNEELKNNLKIIFEECQRARDIIQRLLKFSRPSKGELKRIDVDNCVETVVNLIEHQYSLSGITIKRNYLKDPPFILADEKQMQEVFMNLLNNSRDAMAGGGVIEITTSLDNTFLRIDFKDTGLGMPEEVMKMIFEPFFTTKESGTGLGLSVCYGIIKAHNGELKFESQPNKGTTATILLPLGEISDV